MIRVESRGAVRVVTLDRADKRNALTVKMLRELQAAISITKREGALVLLGAGPVFCAGFDLKERERGDHDGLATLRRQLTELSEVLDAMSHAVPVVVGVHGAAVAGGCALLGAADVVIAEQDAMLGYPVLRLGISPAVTGPWLRHAVGDGRARSLMLDPTLIDARRALAMGLVHETVEGAEALERRAIEVAEALAAKPSPLAMTRTKDWLRTIASRMADEDTKAALAASLGAIDDDTATRLAGRK